MLISWYICCLLLRLNFVNMPPKKRSRPGFDKNLFVSAAASLRYTDYNIRRLAIPERGLDVPGSINDEIEKRKWTYLCANPDPAIAPLVMEFYANAKEDGGANDTVFVRGKKVNFSAEAINKFYELTVPEESNSFHDFLDKHVDWGDVIDSVCRDQTVWNHCKSSKEVSAFPTKQLAAFSRAWFYFVSAKLMPASHLSTVHRNRAALLFAIINDIPVDIGRVINESISTCIHDESLAFVCPSLITSLCKAAGVFWHVHEPLMPEKGMFDSKAFHKMKDRTSGFGTTEEFEHPPPPPPPQKKTMPQQLGEMEQLVKNHIADFNSFKSHVVDMFAHHRQLFEVLHQSLVELSKKEDGVSVVLPPLPACPIPSSTTESDSE